MSNQITFSRRDVHQLREHIQQAITTVQSERGSQKLQRLLFQCRDLLAAKCDAPATLNAVSSHRSIDFTIEDESYVPYGREWDVRIYFDWVDRDPGDDPAAPWGASIRDIEVLAVRCFDHSGNIVSLDEHYLDAAWDLVESQRERIVAKCSEGLPAREGRDSVPPGELRMAPSQRERSAAGGRRKQG